MFYLGLRPNTVRLIEVRHINFIHKTLFVPRSNIKTRQDDTFPIPNNLYNLLWNYLEIRSKFIHNNIYLFPSIRTLKPTSRWSISAKVRRIMKQSGIAHLSFIDKSGYSRMSKNLYSLRHSFGSRVWKATKDIQAVALMLGHVDVECRCAMRYVHCSKIEDRKEIIKSIFNE